MYFEIGRACPSIVLLYHIPTAFSMDFSMKNMENPINFLHLSKKRGMCFQIPLRFEKYKKRNLKKYSKNHLHSKGKCAIIQQLYPCNAYGEVLKWSKRRDSKSRRALTRRVGSNPTFSARKKQVARLAFFYPSRRLGISSPREVRRISSAPTGLYLITRQRACSLRLDDIQHFVLVIYRNKLRMIYKAPP